MTLTEIQTEASPESKPEVQNEALLDIPAAHRAAVQRAVEIALEVVKRDRPLNFPRSAGDRANGFAAWLEWIEEKRAKHEPIMRAAIAEAFADAAPLDEMAAQKYVDCCVWPAVEFWLHDIAIRYYAGAWARTHYGDAIGTYPMEPNGELWRVPLGIRGYADLLGQIMLDHKGNVIENLTTTRQEIQEILRDRKLSPAAAAAG